VSILALLIGLYVFIALQQYNEQRDIDREMRPLREYLYGKPPPRWPPRWLKEFWRGVTAKADR
jgi:hypothetical protein